MVDTSELTENSKDYIEKLKNGRMKMEKEKKKVLIVIDVQNDFVTGSLGTPEAQKVVPNIINKVNEYNERDDAIIFTADTHRDDYLNTQEGKKLPISHCIVGTNGWNFVPELGIYEPSPMEKIYIKEQFGYNWNKCPWLNAYDIEVIGLVTDICVVSNALILKAAFPENKITVDASCCAGSTPEKHKAALEVRKSGQINVIGE